MRCRLLRMAQHLKRYSTGNVYSVKSKDIQKQPVNNPLLALQGRVPELLLHSQRAMLEVVFRFKFRDKIA